MPDKSEIPKIEYRNITISFTPGHLERLDKLAFERKINRSLMVRALVDEEWERKNPSGGDKA